MRRGTKRAACSVAAFAALALGGIARADTAADARARAAEARAQERALAGDVAAQSERIDGLESEIAAARSELQTLEASLARARGRLARLQLELDEKTRTIARARREFRVAQRRLGERLVEIYTSDEPDALAVALGAESLDELLDGLELRSRAVDRDVELVGRIRELRIRVVAERRRVATLRRAQASTTSAIARRTSRQRAALSSLVARRDALASLRAARRRSLASLRVDRRAWEAQANALEAAAAQVTAAIPPSPPPGVAATAAPPAPSVGFAWPVRGTLVSPFGQRWGRLHAGIDVAAPAGTPVVASASGRVVYAGAMSGYGLIVVLQHAGGIATAYAHNSSIAVAVGQDVAQGQAIAAVGCTGSCFGDHVHFEVRVNGSPVDPMAYL